MTDYVGPPTVPTMDISSGIFITRQNLHHCSEKGNQSLGQPETKNEFGAGHEHLRRQSFEEAGNTFVLQHAGHDSETRLRVLEVSVLNSGLDNVKGSGDNQAGRCTGDGGDKVLAPGSLVIILKLEQFFFGPSRSAKERERTGGISSGRPPGSTIETESFIGNNAKEASRSESFRVRLPLDLEYIER